MTTFAAAAKADPSLTLAKVNEAIALMYLQKLPEAEKLSMQRPSKIRRTLTFGTPSACSIATRIEPISPLRLFRRFALKPGDPDTHYMIASVEFELNNLPTSKAEYQKALELDPHHASSLFGLARVLRREGDTAGAQQALARFQHISAAKLGNPALAQLWRGRNFARVEDAALAPTRVEPMIRSRLANRGVRILRHRQRPAPAAQRALMDLSSDSEPALILMGEEGDDAIRVVDRVGSTRFAEVPANVTGIHLAGTGLACAVGDFDNDGLEDLALAVTSPDGQDRIALYRNLGNGKFEDATAGSGIAATSHPTSLMFVDYDHDGDLDLFITGTPTASHASPNTLWRNNGNKTFTDWTTQAGLEGSCSHDCGDPFGSEQ